MAFLLSKKISAFPSTSPSAATTVAPASAQSTYSEAHHQGPDGAPVTCCLHIKSAAGGSSFSSSGSPPSKDAVLRRIRHHKRAQQIQEAVRTHLAFLSDQAANGSKQRWIDAVDVFSP